jgi:hypothetical protein
MLVHGVLAAATSLTVVDEPPSMDSRKTLDRNPSIPLFSLA